MRLKKFLLVVVFFIITVTLLDAQKSKKHKPKHEIPPKKKNTDKPKSITPEASIIRINYHISCEEKLNQLVNMELGAEYTYSILAHYFDDTGYALDGFAALFRQLKDRHSRHAAGLVRYQKLRGGKVQMTDVKPLGKIAWTNAMEALQFSLGIEQEIIKVVHSLLEISASHNDQHTISYLEETSLDDESVILKRLSSHIRNLKRMGGSTGLTEYLYDRELQNLLHNNI